MDATEFGLKAQQAAKQGEYLRAVGHDRGISEFVVLACGWLNVAGVRQHAAEQVGKATSCKVAASVKADGNHGG
jgi:hypothetical protein